MGMGMGMGMRMGMRMDKYIAALRSDAAPQLALGCRPLTQRQEDTLNQNSVLNRKTDVGKETVTFFDAF